MRAVVDRLIESVFPEEEKRLATWLRLQKHRLWFWLMLAIVLSSWPLFRFWRIALPNLASNITSTLLIIQLCWIIALVCLVHVWPPGQRRSFRDNFKRGIDPRMWEFDGEWKVERDETGHRVLTVTNSDRGGLVIPCLHWKDYEIQFETRIVNEWTGWIVRASSFNDFVHQKLSDQLIHTLYRVSTIWDRQSERAHGLNIEKMEWYRIRILAIGNWLSTWIELDGRHRMLFRDDILGIRDPIEANIQSSQLSLPTTHRQILTPSYRSGSFGFRLWDVERAQYRNLRAFQLR